MNQQQRGKRFGADAERLVAGIFRRAWPEAERTGAGMPTKIRWGQDIKGVPGYHIQVKARSKSWVWGVFLTVWQAAAAAGNLKPLLVIKVKGAPPLAVLKLEDYVNEHKRD